MERILKRIAMITGFVVLAISIYFSYDGFDQSVTGGNESYTTLAMVIGFVLAVVVSVIQFIFGTGYKDLNWTLRVVGVSAYVYSIYTNRMGISHVLGATDFMAWASALFMDVYPEPAIAWALGESLTGDLFGNIGKMVFGTRLGSSVRPPNRGGFRPQYQGNSAAMQEIRKKHQVRQDESPELVSPIFSNTYTKKFKKH
jgi:hypothetical protein